MSKPLIVVFAFLLFAPLLSAQTKLDSIQNEFQNYLKPVKWRCIGPFRGGRSVAACGVIGDPKVYYMGTTGGGLWKSTDMAMSWDNVSDGFFKSGTVGAVSVAASDDNVVYVGMGEHAIRGVMTHSGDGVYKSTDAGKTWKHMGLENTRHISRIIIHPQNPDVTYVAAQGALYGKNPDRGVFKTSDGGLTWKKILFVDENTGAVELSMDANNPRILYAAMWEHGRKPWQVISGGPGSGLYKSTNGGDHWEKMTEGLPKEMGKMSIAVCPSNSEKVYALIESDWEKEAGGLYQSLDAGKSWSKVSGDHRLIQRAWYYIELFPDPNNENILYVLSAPALKSIDGGVTWEDISNTHGDYHDLWINPNDSDNRIVADDGGAAVTFNDGKSWSSQMIYPTAQFYRINVDNQFPYNIYAGQQDNTSVKIASRNISGRSITTNDWTRSAGGESAFLAFDPDDPRFVLGGSYQGTIEVLDTKNKASRNVMAAPIQYLGKDAKDMKYRFNWNAPIIFSKHEGNTYYHGSQLLLRTKDLGVTWEEVSPDLTRNEKEKQGRPGVPYTNEAVGAENYGTLAYIIESPLESGVIYTGSDDGLVYLTKDACKTWVNVTPKGLQECLINAIEVSPFDKATAYIATTRYKFNDHRPGLYKTTDYGKTWTAINKGIPDGAFTRVVRADDKVKDLLYAGTESGLFISRDGGLNWLPFQLNLPVTPITDLRVHQGNLIAATSGRSFWILDDLHVVQNYQKGEKQLSILPPSSNYLTNSSSSMDDMDASFTGIVGTNGVNAASGLVIYYHLPEVKEGEEIQMVIKDQSGAIVHSFSSKSDSLYARYDGGPDAEPVLSTEKGLNRFVWNMRHGTMLGVKDAYIEGSYQGHKASPGMYEIVLTNGSDTAIAKAEILANPTYEVTPADYQEYHTVMKGMEDNYNEMIILVNSLDSKRKQLEDLVKHLPKESEYQSLKTEGDSLIQRMLKWDEDMVQRKSKAYDDVENFPNKFTADYLYLINQTESELPKVNQPSKDLLLEYNTRWTAYLAQANQIIKQEIPALNAKLWKAGVGAIWMK